MLGLGIDFADTRTFAGLGTIAVLFGEQLQVGKAQGELEVIANVIFAIAAHWRIYGEDDCLGTKLFGFPQGEFIELLVLAHIELEEKMMVLGRCRYFLNVLLP